MRKQSLVLLVLLMTSCDDVAELATMTDTVDSAAAEPAVTEPVASEPVVSATAESVTSEPVVAASPEPVLPVWEAPATPVDEQIVLKNVSPASETIYTVYGSDITLSYSIENPLSGTTPRCLWYSETPAQPEKGVEAVPWHITGNVGLCTSWRHTQPGSVNQNYKVVVTNGKTYASYTWNIVWQESPAYHEVSASAVTQEGTYRVYDSKVFQVYTYDVDGNATCEWLMDGTVVSTGNCRQYTYTPTAGVLSQTLQFRLTGNINTATRTWTVKPAAKLLQVSPLSATVTTTQTYTATFSDPYQIGVTCGFKRDGIIVQGVVRGNGYCSYTYTKQDSSNHTIKVELSYSPAEIGDTATVYAFPPENRGVSIDSVIPSTDITYYYSEGQTTGMFGVDGFTDPDTDGWFTWYLNGNETDCDLSSLCTYTNAGLRNGIQLDNFPGGRTVIKVVFTDGQNSSSRTWYVNEDRPTIFDDIRPGTICNKAGTQFWIHGKAFESTDTFKLWGWGTVLNKVSVQTGSVLLSLPADMPNGAFQAVMVTKGSFNDTTTTPWVTFSSAVCN